MITSYKHSMLLSEMKGVKRDLKGLMGEVKGIIRWDGGCVGCMGGIDEWVSNVRRMSGICGYFLPVDTSVIYSHDLIPYCLYCGIYIKKSNATFILNTNLKLKMHHALLYNRTTHSTRKGIPLKRLWLELRSNAVMPIRFKTFWME